MRIFVIRNKARDVRLMGLPAVGNDNGRGRMIIYFGDPRYENVDDPDYAYTGALVDKTIKAANIRVNAITMFRFVDPPGFVGKLAQSTGGRELQYTKVGSFLSDTKATPKQTGYQKEELAAALDQMLSNPPPSALDAARAKEPKSFQWDVPNILLQIALIAAVGLAACRLGMRL